MGRRDVGRRDLGERHMGIGHLGGGHLGKRELGGRRMGANKRDTTLRGGRVGVTNGLRVYVLFVAALGALALAQSLRTLSLVHVDPLMLAILIGLAAAAQRMPVFLFRSSAISISFAAVIASYVLYGSEVAVIVSLFQAGVNAFTPRRKPLLKALFNAGSLATSAFVGGSVYRLVGGQVPPGELAVTLVAVAVVAALIGALEAKESRTAKGAAQTMFHAVQVATTLGCSDDELAAVKLGALFHDIGTIGVPEPLLRKPSALDAREWAEVKAHPVIGANLLSNVPMLERIRPIVLSHHERFDGTGYPQGLRADKIPLAAQIIAVADAYQAMTQSRPYRPALSAKAALRELRANSGTQFNPVVVEAFIKTVVGERRKSARGAESPTEQVYQQAVEAVRVSL